MKFERERELRTIMMNQMKYIKEILKYFNMEENKPVGIPFDANSKLLKLLMENLGCAKVFHTTLV